MRPSALNRMEIVELMSVANLELCRELYELSGWKTELSWMKFGKHLGNFADDDRWTLTDGQHGDFAAYDLGYLLRKLDTHSPELYKVASATWRCKGRNYTDISEDVYHKDADTPEDAACKLAIELFKQGVLK